MNPRRQRHSYSKGTWIDDERYIGTGLYYWMGRCGQAWCTDGKLRTIRAHKAMDSRKIKAQTRVRGITVQGWVEVVNGTLFFFANPDGKNARLLPRK